MEEQDQQAPQGKSDGPKAPRKPRSPEQIRAAAKRRNQAKRAAAAALAGATIRTGPANASTMHLNPVAGPVRMKGRHWGIILSFLAVVCAPTAITFWYLKERAADQFASTIGFAVRKEDSTTATDSVAGIIGGSSGSNNDTDILYEFIQSQQIVEQVEKRLNLKAIYSKPQNDPYFSFNPDGSIEDLLAYWGSMVKVYFDRGSGLITIRVHAFTAEDAQQIALAIFDESSLMINRLNAISREDGTKYAELDLQVAVEKLKAARQAITAFRNKAQIVDPNADIQAQMGLLTTLQQQLASALIELDLLSDTTRENDPRVEQAKRKISVIEKRIADERGKFAAGENENGDDYAKLINEYEGLTVEREFAERSYLSALTAFDTARAEALRKSRYLAAYVEPTLAQTAQYPERLTLLGMVSLFILIIWSIMVLVYYSIRDRR